MDCEEHSEENGNTDKVTLKSYKYDGKFNPKTTSTCPMVPKHHRTFGRPNLYETVSQEMDRKSNPSHRISEMESLIVKKDRIVVDDRKKEVTIYNEFGQKIMYEEALNDMVELEEEMIKLGSYFINKHEYITAENDIERAEFGEDEQARARKALA